MENPREFLCTRLTKFAHTFAPLSFPVRHLALGHINGPLGEGLLGRVFLLISTIQSAALLLLGFYALARYAPRHSIYWAVSMTLFAQPLLVGMSRLRVPLLPLLFIALAAWKTRSTPSRGRVSAACLLAALLILWGIDRESFSWLLNYTWSTMPS